VIDAKLSLFTSEFPPIQGKTYHLEGGELKKETAGSMCTGKVVVREYADVHELAAILQSVQTNQMISSSVPVNGLLESPIVTTKNLPDHPEAIARSKACFEFPAGQRGHVVFDYDPEPGKPALNRDELYSALDSVIPSLDAASVLWWCSGSSFIFDGDTEIQGLRGQRFYLLVQDVADTERFGDTLAKRLWLSGYGHIEVSKSGALLTRTILDTAMFEAARIDYAGGSTCKPPLSQHRPAPLVLSEGDWYDTNKLKSLSPIEETTYQHLLDAAKVKLEPAAAVQKAIHRAQREKDGVAKLKVKGVPESEAVERINRTLDTSDKGILSGDYEIILESGEVVTVAEILADKTKYHSLVTLDPVEPDYLDSKPVGHLNLIGGAPNLFSHAHGGKVYSLVESEFKTSPQWKTEILQHSGNIPAVMALAVKIKNDAALSGTEQNSLLKACAKDCNVALPVLLADLRAANDYQIKQPVIVVNQSDFAGTVDAAIRVLPAIPTLRQRSGQLVELVQREGENAQLQPVTAIRLAYLSSQVCKWQQGANLGKPDQDTLLAAMGAGSWPGVPKIEGLLHQPTLDLKSGEIINGTGFIPSLNREAVFSSLSYPECKEDPLPLLLSLLDEFPFPSGADKSAALAGILSAAARSAFPTAPFFLINATASGSGKTYLQDIFRAFANIGENLHWPTTQAEQEKTIYSALLAAEPGICFDNLEASLHSAYLCQVATSEVIAGRKLSTNEMPKVSTCAFISANGVNVTATGDLRRRTLTINLDPQCENPFDRAFENNPVDTVKANRGYWVMVALKFLSDYLKSGQKVELSPFGSFEAWSRVVRSAIVVAGLSDPLTNLAANTTSDDDSDDRNIHARLFYFWNECADTANEFFTLYDLTRLVKDAEGVSPRAGMRMVLEEIAGERGTINLRRLGKWFAKHKGQVVDGTRLVPFGEDKRGVIWGVQRVQACAAA